MSAIPERDRPSAPHPHISGRLDGPQRVLVAGTLLAVLLIEVIALRQARTALTMLTAIPVVVALAGLLWPRHKPAQPPAFVRSEEFANGPAEVLRHWQARTTMLVTRADGTRAEWDRHIRPLLAKEFELSVGAKNRKALVDAGIGQFGPQLWRWVDPENSATRDHSGRAPGRAALDDILCRLLSR